MAGDKSRSKSGDKGGKSRPGDKGGKDKKVYEKREKPARDHVQDYKFGDKPKKREGKFDDKDKKKFGGGAVDFTGDKPSRGGSDRGGRGRGSDRGGRGGRGGSFGDRGGRGGSRGGSRGSDRGGRGGGRGGSDKPFVAKNGEFEVVK
jgi:hypothetical protein